MTEILLVVGVVVFFITVCGAIMVGGHLLEELANAETAPEELPVARSAGAVAPATVPS